MKKVLFLLFVCLIISGCGKKLESGKITCGQKDNLLLSKNSVLIDVREIDEYISGHLKNAINIPYDEIIDGVKNKKISINDSIIVYCKSGGRSSKAFQSLIDAGYKHVYDLGSISNCKE